VSALHQPCVGDEVIDSWKAVDVVDFVEDHQGEDFPDAGDSAKHVNGHGIMFGNVCIDLSFDSEDLFVKGVHESGIYMDGGTNHRVGESVFSTAAKQGGDLQGVYSTVYRLHVQRVARNELDAGV